MLAPVAKQTTPAGKHSAAGSPASQIQNKTSSADANGTMTDRVAISCEDIQKVQNLIEKCLQLYMSQDEVVKSLSEEAQIQPRFTTLVWQKLEEQNPEFFRAYYTRLKLKDQIVLFNHLLEQQVQMFQKISAGWVQQPNPQLIAGQVRPGMQIQTVQNAAGSYPRPPLGMQPMAVPASVPQVPPPISAGVAAAASRTAVTAAAAIKPAANTQHKAAAAATQAQLQAPPGPTQPAVSAAPPGSFPQVPASVAPTATATPEFIGTAALTSFEAPGGALTTDAATGAAPASDASGQQETLSRNFSLPDLTLENTGTLELLNGEGAGELELEMPLL